MKKKYIKPTIEILQIDTQQLMAGSPGSISFDSDDGSGLLNDDEAGYGL